MLKPCKSAGCPQLQPCPTHGTAEALDAASRRQFDRMRDSDPLRRLYKTWRWMHETRPRVIARDPLCKDCGREASTICDHIIRAAVWVQRGGNFYDIENLQGLCKRCHDRKTAKESGWAGSH